MIKIEVPLNKIIQKCQESAVTQIDKTQIN